MACVMVDVESQRLGEADARGVPWRRWGPYLSERQWGTVREDYGGGHDTCTGALGFVRNRGKRIGNFVLNELRHALGRS